MTPVLDVAVPLVLFLRKRRELRSKSVSFFFSLSPSFSSFPSTSLPPFHFSFSFFSFNGLNYLTSRDYYTLRTTSHHITPRHLTPHHITSQCTLNTEALHHTISHHNTPRHLTPHHIISHHIISQYIISQHTTSYHITSHHITPHHITMYAKHRRTTSHHRSHHSLADHTTSSTFPSRVELDTINCQHYASAR